MPGLRRRIGTVFQVPAAAQPRRSTRTAFALRCSAGLGRTSEPRCRETLELVGLADRVVDACTNCPAANNSGRDRACVRQPAASTDRGRASGNLDPTNSVGIMRPLDRINRTGTTVLMYHDARPSWTQMRKRVGRNLTLVVSCATTR